MIAILTFEFAAPHHFAHLCEATGGIGNACHGRDIRARALHARARVCAFGPRGERGARGGGYPEAGRAVHIGNY